MDDNARTGELRRKLEKDPGSRLFAQLAEELRKEGKHDEAISVARKGLEKNPNYPSARLTLARALLDSGRPSEARPELESIVKASPDNIMASRLLGDALAELGETTQALKQFERTLLISPADKAVMERMAEVKARMAPASSAPAPAPVVTTPAAAPAPPTTASVALDRDLASGTFSPGSLNAADIQRHFDETAAPASPIDATVGFGDVERQAAASEAETIAFAPQPSPVEPAVEIPIPVVAAPAALPELPSVEMPPVETPPEDADIGAKTLPLTSLTLADLYLQQGLKAEASAVLSQVLKEEPENTQARSKFDAVSSELAQASASVTPRAEAALSPSLPAPAATVAAPRSRAEVRERAILSLKAFASAVEREAVHQKATERGAF